MSSVDDGGRQFKMGMLLLACAVVVTTGLFVYMLFNPQTTVPTEMGIALMAIFTVLGVTILFNTDRVRLAEPPNALDQVFNPPMRFEAYMRAYMQTPDGQALVYDGEGHEKPTYILASHSAVFKRLESVKEMVWYPGYFDPRAAGAEKTRRYIRFLLSEEDTMLIGLGMLLNLEPALQAEVAKDLLLDGDCNIERSTYGIRDRSHFVDSEAPIMQRESAEPPTLTLIRVRPDRKWNYMAGDLARWQAALLAQLLQRTLVSYKIPRAVWAALCGPNKPEEVSRTTEFVPNPLRHARKPTLVSPATAGRIVYTSTFSELKARLMQGGVADEIIFNTQPTPCPINLSRRVGQIMAGGTERTKRTYRLIENGVGRAPDQQEVTVIRQGTKTDTWTVRYDRLESVQKKPLRSMSRQVEEDIESKYLRADGFGFAAQISGCIPSRYTSARALLDDLLEQTVQIMYNANKSEGTVTEIHEKVNAGPDVNVNSTENHSVSNVPWYAVNMFTKVYDDISCEPFSIQCVTENLLQSEYIAMHAALIQSYGRQGFAYIGYTKPVLPAREGGMQWKRDEAVATCAYFEFVKLGELLYVALPARTELPHYLTDGRNTLFDPPPGKDYVAFVIPERGSGAKVYAPTNGESAVLVSRDGTLRVMFGASAAGSELPPVDINAIPAHRKRLPHRQYAHGQPPPAPPPPPP